MKFSSQEEYGIRCLVQIGRAYQLGKALTIPEISDLERISHHNVAKILRVLRLGGILESERGQSGGYTLTKYPGKIKISEVMNVLGGRLFDDEFCQSHSGFADICTNTTDCSVRSLWKIIQNSIDETLQKVTLKDLMGSELDFFEKMNGLQYNLQ